MYDQIKALLAVSSGLPISAITDHADLSRDLGLDSLDTVELVTHLEDMFEISIPERDYKHFQTVNQLCNYLKVKQW